jgi:hypothetical protein
MTTAGGGAAVTVSLRWLSELWSMLSALALPMITLPNSTATPNDNAAVLNLLFMVVTTPILVRLSDKVAERESVIDDPITMRLVPLCRLR